MKYKLFIYDKSLYCTYHTTDYYHMENTLIIIKPDGVKRGLIGKIIGFFEERGIYIADMKMKTPSKENIKKHYSKFINEPFFKRISDFMTSGNVVICILKGYNIIESVRQLIGSTNPILANPNTIRGKYGHCIQENLIHASENSSEFEKEYKIWFSNE